MGELFNKLDANDVSAIDKWVDEKSAIIMRVLNIC